MNANLVQQIRVTVAEALAEQGKKKYEDKLTFLSKWLEAWNEKLSESNQESQEISKTLSESYRKLRDDYQKWETLKSNELVLHKIKSNIQTRLCSPLFSGELRDCLSLELQ